MRLHTRYLGVTLFLANVVIVPLLYVEVRPHMIDWWNVGAGLIGAAVFLLSFVPWGHHG